MHEEPPIHDAAHKETYLKSPRQSFTTAKDARLNLPEYRQFRTCV